MILGEIKDIQYKIFLNLIVVLMCLNAFAQKTFTGKIVDQQNEPIAFANIVAYKKIDGSLLTGVTSNTEGVFTITVNEKEFFLEISFIGFATKKVKPKEENLKTIILEEDGQQLEEVVITSRKKLIQQKVDRLVFNVGNSISATGGDALDALKVAPRIKVLNDKISMIGKSRMSVMVNNKLIQLEDEDLNNFLKSIPSDNIDNIEIITTPPSKYDAEGNSGIININLKRTKLNQWRASLKSSYSKNSYNTGVIGGSFDYQKNDISIYSNINYINGAYGPVEINRIYYPKGLWNEENNRKNTQNNLSLRLGLDYQLSKKWNVGLQYIGGVNTPKIIANSVTSVFNKENIQVDRIINTTSENKGKKNIHSINLNSQIKLDSVGNNISLNVDYLKYGNYNNNTFNTLNVSSGNNKSTQNIENFSASIDIETPLKFINLNYGGKVSFVETLNDVSFFDLTSGNPIFDPSQSNKFDYKENTQAIYLNASKTINKKWQTQFGVRFENTQTEGYSKTLNQKNKNSYSKFFPVFYLTFLPNESNSLSLNYNRRISRPSYNRLNPFRWYNNPFSYTEGNPFLQPSFSNNIDLNYTYKNNWSTSLYYSETDNGFEQITMVDDSSNIQRTIVENYFETKIIGISKSYTFNQIKWWSNTLSFDWNYSESKALIPITNQNLRGSNAYFSTSNDFTLNKNKTLLFNLSYWYNFKGYSDLDQNNAYSQLDASLKYFAFDKKLQITLSGNDLLSSNRPIYTSYTNNIKIDYENYYDYRRVRLTLSYNFGNKDISVSRKRIGNQDEKNRTN